MGCVAELDAAKFCLGPFLDSFELTIKLIFMPVVADRPAHRHFVVRYWNPSLQHCPVHRVVLIAEQRLGLSRVHKLLKELPYHLVEEDPFTVLNISDRLQDCIISAEVHIPSER